MSVPLDLNTEQRLYLKNPSSKYFLAPPALSRDEFTKYRRPWIDHHHDDLIDRYTPIIVLIALLRGVNRLRSVNEILLSPHGSLFGRHPVGWAPDV